MAWTQADADQVRAAIVALASGKRIVTVEYAGPPQRSVTYASAQIAELRISWLDRMLIGIAPRWGQRRIEARARVQLMARHYEAAQIGRRTSGWQRTSSDANIANGPALLALRELSRDLRRNNGWAKRGVQVITNNTVGWGILPKAKARPNHASGRARAALELWNDWADTTACDYDGRLNFYGLQRLAMETIASRARS
jgi:capsid protein